MLLVSDANIFIDLERIGLLIEFSKLDIKISTSDFVFNELNEKQQMLDYSIYYFAKKYKAYLLSNDKALRKFSNKKNIEVKGIFYILDLIIEQSELSKNDLHTSISLLLNNSWLPKNEINIRLERLINEI